VGVLVRPKTCLRIVGNKNGGWLTLPHSLYCLARHRLFAITVMMYMLRINFYIASLDQQLLQLTDSEQGRSVQKKPLKRQDGQD